MTATRILVVASELPPGPGGIGTHAHELALALARAGRDVRLLGSQHYATEAERRAFARTSPVPVVRWPDGPDPLRTALRRRRALRRELDAFRPDVVIASGGRVLWLAAQGVDRSVALVAVAHGTELGGPAWQRRLTRWALDRSSHVVAVSRFTAGLVAELGVRTTTSVVPNGAAVDRFGPDPQRAAAFRDRYGLGDRPLVVTVGNVTERKGQHLVVDALPHLVTRVPEVRYVVVGRPTDGDLLAERARRLGVDGHLLLTGQVDADQVRSALAAADVFAMTSTATASGDVEGFGIAVLEAALSGVPAVVTRGTGAEEAIVPGHTGLAVDPDARSIAGALVGLLEDPARRAGMGAEAERRARSDASWPRRAERYAAIADTLAGPGHVARRLLVVSHTEHWRAADGTVVGLGSTTRELDHLASVVGELVHVAPRHEGPPPALARPPQAPNLRHVPVPAAGGDRLRDKVVALLTVPRWVVAIDRELRRADAVHVRCPAGISMVALAVLAVRRRPRHRWVKYAGDWRPGGPTPLTYRLQRWWLHRGLARAAVTVNGRWPDQPPWVHAFDNPTLSEEEVRRAADGAVAKHEADGPLRVVFAGRLDERKGAVRAVDVVLALRARGVDVGIDVVGDGPGAAAVQDRVARHGPDVVRRHGWLSREALDALLAAGHVFLLPSSSEGFPKVVAEAMAHGCVPVTSAVGSLGQTLGETGGAVVVPPGGDWEAALAGLVDPGCRGAYARAGLRAVGRFTYERYLERVRGLAATWR